MSFSKKFWSMIMAIIPSWILSIPIFRFLIKKKQEQAYKQAYVNMLLNDSLSKDDDELMAMDGELPKGLSRELMPRHLAMILDGNRRWAKKRGLAPVEGYKAGLANVGDIFTLCLRWKIPIVSFFLFSSENWRRPKEEVEFLLDLFELSLKQYLLPKCHRYGARVSAIGNKSLLPNSLQNAIEHIEQETKDNDRIHLVLAMSYSGQDDIIYACQKIATKVKDGLFQPSDVTRSLFEQHLQTNVTDIPAPDLLIRTSGELRISNYYLWQTAYSEMYFSDALWPDFDEDEFIKALRTYQKRGRRFGRV